MNNELNQASPSIPEAYDDVMTENLAEMLAIDSQIEELRVKQQTLGELMGISMLKCPIEKLAKFIPTVPEDSWVFDIGTRIYSLRRQAETESQAEVLSEVITENLERHANKS